MATTKQRPAPSGKAETTVPTTSTPVIVNESAPSNAEAETTATATAAEDAQRPPMTELTGVRYTGTADSRSLSAADLKTLGVTDPKGDLTWDRSNGKVVPIADVNAATVDALIKLAGFEAVRA